MISKTNDMTQSILRIAKRFGNTKRAYLLVNALQAKHLPCSPTASLRMMQKFGRHLQIKYPNTKLIVGFAETATAIGAAVAACFGQDCIYVHTTREDVADVSKWIYFLEEHSHAVEQKLCADSFETWLEDTQTIIFVDDEISTGKTLMNMISQLKEKFPMLQEKTLVAASIFNRVSQEDAQRMIQYGVQSEYLYRLPDIDYTAVVQEHCVTEAQKAVSQTVTCKKERLNCSMLCNPRQGVVIQEYLDDCKHMADLLFSYSKHAIAPGSNMLVLGTEECMFPALIFGKLLEDQDCGYTVRCHATTRSPIGICASEKYPIASGKKLKSFYEPNRDTYIYNLETYDIIFVISDTALEDLDALENLAGALLLQENQKLYYVQGGCNVWNISRT